MKVFFVICIAFLSLSAETLRIEANVLVKKLSDYIILDTREASDYQKGHIKGALNFPILLTYDNQTKNGKISRPQKIEKVFRELGLDIDKSIVVYDTGIFFDAARLFWTLEVYGFKNVKILNSGFKEWSENSYPTSDVIPKVIKSNYITTINSNRLATKFTTQIATKTPNKIVIDARAYPAYRGEQSTAKRFGHIPSAQNIPATHNINDNKLQSIDKLKDIYKSVDKNKKIVLYCAIGRISSTNYFALRELGYDVANYDASWKEWGNDFSLPITNPSSKK
jgi:thiosulfate/3-mercaptopyruvate sulfurtransferase